MSDPWERTESRVVADYRFFRLRQDTSIHPRHRRAYDFFVFEFPHWVNVIPLTAEGEVVFIRQFRHGIRDVTLEIPGGTIDPGETPLQAALREMEEETGYRAPTAVELGWVNPNPAIQENRCWTFLAPDVVPDGSRHTGGSEAIDTIRIPLGDIPALFEDGTITHALVVTAFHFLRQHRRLPLI